MTAQAPAGPAAAGRAASRQIVAIATTPDPGAAPTRIPPISGRVPPPNPTHLPVTATTREVQVCLFKLYIYKKNNILSLLASRHQGVNSATEGTAAPHFAKRKITVYKLSAFYSAVSN